MVLKAFKSIQGSLKAWESLRERELLPEPLTPTLTLWMLWPLQALWVRVTVGGFVVVARNILWTSQDQTLDLVDFTRFELLGLRFRTQAWLSNYLSPYAVTFGNSLKLLCAPDKLCSYRLTFVFSRMKWRAEEWEQQCIYLTDKVVSHHSFFYHQMSH